jgi:hypothetical protein
MKTKFIRLSAAVLIAAGILSACNSSGNKGDETQGYKDSVAQSTSAMPDTVNTAKTDWEKFKADANEKIRQNEDSIQAFKKRVEKENAKIKVKLEKQITRFEVKNNEMKARLADYKDEGKDKLEKFRVDFNNSMDTLGTNIKDFFKGDKK